MRHMMLWEKTVTEKMDRDRGHLWDQFEKGRDLLHERVPDGHIYPPDEENAHDITATDAGIPVTFSESGV